MRTFPEKKKTEEVVLSKFILLYSSLFLQVRKYVYSARRGATEQWHVANTHSQLEVCAKTRVPDNSETDSIEKTEI